MSLLRFFVFDGFLVGLLFLEVLVFFIVQMIIEFMRIESKGFCK